MEEFRNGKIQVLIATNVAARGLDIPHVDLIVQLEPPSNVDDYIHRSGRTARAGRSGVCVTFFDKKNIYMM
jgi:ATP-dependent RNA helicase DDX21